MCFRSVRIADQVGPVRPCVTIGAGIAVRDVERQPALKDGRLIQRPAAEPAVERPRIVEDLFIEPVRARQHFGHVRAHDADQPGAVEEPGASGTPGVVPGSVEGPVPGSVVVPGMVLMLGWVVVPFGPGTVTLGELVDGAFPGSVVVPGVVMVEPGAGWRQLPSVSRLRQPGVGGPRQSGKPRGLAIRRSAADEDRPRFRWQRRAARSA